MRGQRITKFKCVSCGKVTSGRMPRKGDTSARFPRRHKINGKPCEGNILQAEWIDLNINIPQTRE